jgi:lipoprotein-anchoring transpeptidase ErfK/SrfK
VVRTLEGGLHSGTTTVTWDGRDQHGRLLPEGSYRLVLTATDPFGRQAVADYSDIILLRRRVVVSLRQQRLVAYAGTRAVASTLVTTGNRRLPTPVGTFHILAVYHPFTMVSPWPPSSPDYYAPVHLHDALLFDERGFFIHDAPWRHRFGPGSNALAGRPGQDRTGTHGCVNVPAAFAAWLARWAPVGTAVVVGP